MVVLSESSAERVRAGLCLLCGASRLVRVSPHRWPGNGQQLRGFGRSGPSGHARIAAEQVERWLEHEGDRIRGVERETYAMRSVHQAAWPVSDALLGPSAHELAQIEADVLACNPVF